MNKNEILTYSINIHILILFKLIRHCKFSSRTVIRFSLYYMYTGIRARRAERRSHLTRRCRLIYDGTWVSSHLYAGKLSLSPKKLLSIIGRLDKLWLYINDQLDKLIIFCRTARQTWLFIIVGSTYFDYWLSANSINFDYSLLAVYAIFNYS